MRTALLIIKIFHLPWQVIYCDSLKSFMQSYFYYQDLFCEIQILIFFFTGEISSDYIHRNSLTQKQPNITFIEDMEDDDEQFILNMKTIIDKNYKT